MGMIEVIANEHTFHVFMFYGDETKNFVKQVSFVKAQYEKNIVLHVAHINSDVEQLSSRIDELKCNFKVVFHVVQKSPFEKVSELVGILRTVEAGWICLFKPGDEWLPYHLSAFRDAMLHFKDFQAYLTLNYLRGYSTIKSVGPEDNIINVKKIELKEQLSLSQLMIHSSLLKSNVFPDFKVDSHFDTLFELILVCSSGMVRINRFTNICTLRYPIHTKAYFDQQTLIVCYLIRNIVKDHRLRFYLLFINWQIGFMGLLKAFRLIGAGVFFKEMLCYYVGLKRGVKKGQIYVD
ncbi:MAG TPA: hypothetical protein PK134_08130 [Bacteroidia bacterium]|nr:hypothetical protein [Bacteroidia bacterium]